MIKIRSKEWYCLIFPMLRLAECWSRNIKVFWMDTNNGVFIGIEVRINILRFCIHCTDSIYSIRLKWNIPNVSSIFTAFFLVGIASIFNILYQNALFTLIFFSNESSHRQPFNIPITKILVDHQTEQIELSQFTCDIKSQFLYGLKTKHPKPFNYIQEMVMNLQ